MEDNSFVMSVSIERRQTVLLQIMTGMLLVLCLAVFLPHHAQALTKEDAAAVSGKGWQTLPSGRFTYITDGSNPAKGFLKIKKYWYHFDDEGYLSLGWFSADGHRYYAVPGAKLGKKRGSLKSGYENADGVYCMFSSKDKAGQYGAQELGWVTVKGNTYYYDSDGTKFTGLKEIKGNLYYFSPSGSAKKIGKMKTGWQTIDGKKYYFRSTGKGGALYGAAYRNQTVSIGGKKYTFGEDGAVTEKSSSSSGSSSVTPTEAQKRFIEKIGSLAHADMQSTGVLASVTIAQAIIESAWGTSTLAKNANNLFGMKATLSSTTWESAWDGKTYAVNTQEYLNGAYKTIKADFRKYPDIAASVADHSAYLTGAKLTSGSLRYDGLVGCKDYKKAATIIKKGGYATAPNYVSALVDVIEKYDLAKYDT